MSSRVETRSIVPPLHEYQDRDYFESCVIECDPRVTKATVNRAGDAVIVHLGNDTATSRKPGEEAGTDE